jgi:hypothetical protein
LRELLAGGKKRIAIGESPAVILNVGELNAAGTGGFGEGEHCGELIDVAAVNDEVESDGDTMAFEPFADTEFLRVGFGSGDFVGGLFACALKAQLKMIESGLDESFEARFIERQAGANEIYVEAGSARGADEIEDVRAGEGFAAGEIGLKNAETNSLAKDAGPIFGRKFEIAGFEFEGVGTIDAMKRATVG